MNVQRIFMVSKPHSPHLQVDLFIGQCNHHPLMSLYPLSVIQPPTENNGSQEVLSGLVAHQDTF
jgi:hypothetical protein